MNPTAHELWRISKVLAVTGQSSSTMYEGCARGTFPKPVKLGPRASAWVASEVLAWIEARIAQRDVQG